MLKTCLLVDVAVAADKNASLKIFENLNKYKDREIEIKRIWYLMTTRLPVYVGDLEIISKTKQICE